MTISEVNTFGIARVLQMRGPTSFGSKNFDTKWTQALCQMYPNISIPHNKYLQELIAIKVQEQLQQTDTFSPPTTPRKEKKKKHKNLKKEQLSSANQYIWSLRWSQENNSLSD